MGHLTATLRRSSSDAASDDSGIEAAAGAVLEVGVPLAAFGLTPGAPVAFFVALLDPEEHETERQPPFRPIETAVPDAWFEAKNWNA